VLIVTKYAPLKSIDQAAAFRSLRAIDIRREADVDLAPTNRGAEI
jgi:hypothetical protein